MALNPTKRTNGVANPKAVERAALKQVLRDKTLVVKSLVWPATAC